MKSIKVATAYEIDGKKVLNFPASLNQLARANPIYEELKGWSDWGDGKAMEIAKKGYDALPAGMRDYLDFVSQNAGVPVSIIGIGKERQETIDLRSKTKTRK
jgi:adenylosuccinate synthase